VIIRFCLSPKKDLHELPYLELFFKKIKDHILANDNGLLNPPDLSSSIQFLVIEDFTTKGLEGDPNKAFPTDNDQEENFFYFWRNYGRSGKSENDRGRWGLGKTVFSAVSQISTFFGLTLRNSDHRTLLMGQSVLNTHNINGTYFSPYGYFGIFGNTADEEHFARPIEDPIELKKFTTTFELTRGADPGLSIVIPFPDPEITSARLCEAAIQQFFYPIMSGDLIVGIFHNNRPLTLASDSLKPIIKSNQIAFSNDFDENLTKDNFLRLIAFTEWILKLKNEDFIILKVPENLSRAPKWSDALFDLEQLKNLRTRFDSGEPLAFSVPMKVHKKGSKHELSWFKVFLQRDENLKKPQGYFIREGVTIPGIPSFKERRIRGVVVIDKAPLTTMLGDAENPAHTEWQNDSSKFKNRYEHGWSCLKFVKDSMREIVWRLIQPTGGIDRELLSDIFFNEIPVEQEDKAKKIQKPAEENEGEESEDDFVFPESKPRLIILSRIKSGIAIRKNPRTQDLPVSVRAEFAYNVRKGNPFKKYLPADFALEKDPLIVESKNVRIMTKANNILEFEIENSEFSIEISGFDENRDLVVKANYRMESA
jgi:hypothetical protein